MIEPEEIASKTGYSRPHTIHCGPDGIYVSALGAPDGNGPGGIFLLDHDNFSVKGAWEQDRGPQELAYDFWWHLNQGTVITSEWGTPNMVENGLQPDLLLSNQYGHKLHIWDLEKRTHVQEIDLGAEHQMVLELRPAHDPRKAYGFVGVVASTADLTASVWLWERNADGTFKAEKVITIPPEPAETEQLPPALQPFGAVPPLVTDIALSVDDQSLVVSCWGTGELKRYDVSDPRNPRETGSVRLGGIVERAAHPAAGALNGGPQMVELSRDGKRVYLTNSLYASWDAQFYPEGIDGWLVKLDAGEDGSLTLDPDLFVEFSGERPHQVRLAGGDASSDSYCFPDMSALMHDLWPWILLGLLGAYHGLNPAMGWLFAVALGMQERDRRAVSRALPAIAIGHEASILVIAVLVLGLGLITDPSALHLGAGVALIAFGLFRFIKPRAHFRWVMRGNVGRRELVGWSFLMSTAHGAGLMVAPVLIGAGAVDSAAASDHAIAAAQDQGLSIPGAALGITLHVAAMLAVMWVVATLVYKHLGVAVVKQAWVNLDAVWAGAFVLAGVLTLFT